MHSRDIVVSPDLVIRFHGCPTGRQRTLRARLPEAVAVLLGSTFLVMTLMVVMITIA
jgi:hypothetical protein